MHVSDSLHLALSTLRSRGWRFAWPLAIALLTLAQAGCGGDKAAAPEANTATPAAAADLSPAQQVLQRMVVRYREAKSYRDQGVVRLKYRQQGQWFEDEGQLTIALVRPNQLQLRAYQLTLVSDGNRLHAVIADPDSNDMDGQVVVRQAPPRFRLDTIYEDPILMDVMSGGMGGPPVTLELLLSDTPLKELLASSRGVELAAEGTVGDRVCDRVVLKLDEGQLVFWVDRQSHLLRRLEYPAERLTREMAAGNCTDVSLTAEFLEACIDEPVPDAEFAFAVPPGAKTVSRFVLPPRPLPSELLGQLPGDFFFTGLHGERLSRDLLLGKVAVLLWFNDHPASHQAIGELERVRKALAGAPQIACYAVCTEPSSVSHPQVQTLAQRWGGDVPVVRDLQAFGRDLFRIPFAPTLIVLDARGVIQVFEVGANPNLAAELPDRLRLLVAGEDLAAPQLTQYRQQQMLYEKKLAESAGLAPQDARVPQRPLRKR
jgi:hypothetical protein